MADLVTLQDYKDYKGITTTDQDVAYEALITQVSTLVKTYCDRTFVDNYSVDKIESYDGFDNSSIFLSEFPVVSITSVTTSTDGGVTVTPFTDYYVDNDTGELTTGNGTMFIQNAYNSIPFKSLTITYMGGFLTIPDDLKLVVLDIVYYYHSSSFNPNKRLQSASVDTVSFSKLGDSSYPPHIKRVLDMYRSIKL